MKVEEMVQISRVEDIQLSPCHSWGHKLRRSGRSSRCSWNPPGTLPLSHVGQIMLCESTQPLSPFQQNNLHWPWRVPFGALDLRHRGDSCSIPSDSMRFESAPWAVGTKHREEMSPNVLPGNQLSKALWLSLTFTGANSKLSLHPSVFSGSVSSQFPSLEGETPCEIIKAKH